MGVKMEEITVLEQRIEKLEHDHKSFVEFGAMCFIGILTSGMIIDHTHNYSLWFVIILLSVALISTIVVAVKKDLEKDSYVKELEQFQAIQSQFKAA